MTTDTPYNYRVVKQFTWAAIVFGIVGMLVGVIIAAQLRWPTLFGGIDFLSYGRLRPVHTSGVIFAFGGNALFATSYYVVQRVCSVRLVSDKIAAFTFYGYQLFAKQGIRGTAVAAGRRPRRSLGRLWLRLLLHHRQAPRKTHLRRPLVLRRLHHRRRRAAHFQQPRPAD